MPDGTIKEKYWNSNHDCFDLEFRRKHLKIRIEEVTNLIDEIFREGFLQEYCGFSDQIDFETEKLVMGGHSFGGMTAIAVSEKDDRVKATFGFDAWTWCVNQRI